MKLARSHFTFLVALAILTLGASQASAQNALKNPGFEDPTVDTGSSLGQWFRFASGTGSSTESTVDPRSGSRHIDLEVVGANQFAGVFQRLESVANPGTPLSINPGATLTFSGFHKLIAPVGGTPPTSELKIEWTGAPQNRLDVIALPAVYGPFTHTGIAPAGTTGATITYAISTFGAGQGDSQVYIDDFTVTFGPFVPEPATAGMIGAGALGLVGFVRRRRK
jgi:hypothetical protein